LCLRTKLINSIESIQSIKGIEIDGNDVRVLPEENTLTEDGYAVIDIEFVVREK
jgi:hypothetical protein